MGSSSLLPGGPRLIGGSTIQYVPAKTAPAATAVKKSILLKAPPSKLIVSSPQAGFRILISDPHWIRLFGSPWNQLRILIGILSSF